MRITVHDYAGHPFEFELSRALAARGHTVRHLFFGGDQGPKGETTLLPTDPPSFSIQPVDIAFKYRKDRFLRRFLGDIAYGHAAGRSIRAFRPDVVISGNTPLEAQLMIERAARACGSQFIFWVQDFYSVAVRRLLGGRWRGAGGLVAARYERLEATLLERSGAVILISDDFRCYLPASLASRGTVHTIPNWGPLNDIPQRPKRNDWSHRHGFAERFTFLYTGTMALKHDPDLIWGIAEQFSANPQVQVGVVGSGVNFDALKTRNAVEPLGNLTLLPPQPMAEFPEVLAAADVLVAVLEHDAGEFSVPSKVLSYLCAGRPILLSAPLDNLASRILQESGAGLFVPAGDAAGLRAAAKRLYDDADLRRRCGEAGRAYAGRHFDIGRIAPRFEEVLGSLRPRTV